MMDVYAFVLIMSAIGIVASFIGLLASADFIQNDDWREDDD